MRHSTIDLTMNTYTDPKLLDVCGALDSLPSLNLNASPATERNAMRATGTDCRESSLSTDSPNNSPDAGKSRHSGSFAVIASGNADRRTTRKANAENLTNPSEKALFAGFASKASQVGMTGFEPATSTSRMQPHRVATEQSKEVPATLAIRDTNGDTNSPENDHGGAVAGSVSSRAELLPIKGDSFSAALAMIASLPLSDAEKADAVRRLMAEQAAGSAKGV